MKDQKKAKTIEAALLNTFKFVEDVKPLIYPEHVNVAFGLKPKSGKWIRKVPAQQYVHRSGTNFIRLLHDDSGSTLFVFLENRKHITANPELARDTLNKVLQYVEKCAKPTD